MACNNNTTIAILSKSINTYIRLVERTIEHSRTDNSIFKKSNVIYSVKKKNYRVKIS